VDPDIIVFVQRGLAHKIACYLGAGNRIEEYRSGTLVVNWPTPEVFTMRMFAEADRNDIAAITRGRARVESDPEVDQPEQTGNHHAVQSDPNNRVADLLVWDHHRAVLGQKCQGVLRGGNRAHARRITSLPTRDQTSAA
jgi:hypothetical protein